LAKKNRAVTGIKKSNHGIIVHGNGILCRMYSRGKTQEAGAGTAGTLSVPVNGDSPARAVNRTPGDNPPA